MRQIRSTEDDETYLNLIHEVDVERERRWKAEQATRKLLDNMKVLKETRKIVCYCVLTVAALILLYLATYSIYKNRNARKNG